MSDMHGLVPATQTAIVIPLDELEAEARRIIDQGRSANTRRAYRKHWQRFGAWCNGRGLPGLPATPETVVAYLTERARTHKVATVELDATAIGAAHRVVREPNPCATELVRAFLRGLRRDKGIARSKKAPLTRDLLERGLPVVENAHVSEGLRARYVTALRDRAMLLLGFWSGCRRAELVALTIGDVQAHPSGLAVHVRRSKTDQEGVGTLIGVPYVPNRSNGLPVCPVGAVAAWLVIAPGGSSAPLFRAVRRNGATGHRHLHPKIIAEAVKRCAVAAGVDPVPYSGHSLRSGLATEAAQAGIEARLIQRQLRHATSTMTDEYIHAASAFDNAANALAVRPRSVR
jgi:integrase